MDDLNWRSESKPREVPNAPRTEFIFKEPSYVGTVNNHVYFYSEVDTVPVLELNKAVRTLANDLLYNAYVQDREPAKIFLHINSYGGSLLHGLSAMDSVATCKVPVVTIVDGHCASAATLISVAGKQRLIYPNSFMLIHQLSACTWGKFEELQDFNKNMNRFMETIRSVYGKYTKVPTEKLDEILKHDLWFDAAKCVEYGLVDNIVDKAL